MNWIFSVKSEYNRNNGSAISIFMSGPDGPLELYPLHHLGNPLEDSNHTRSRVPDRLHTEERKTVRSPASQRDIVIPADGLLREEETVHSTASIIIYHDSSIFSFLAQPDGI
ncbi:unnamed protein product [Protopolystoma xenopodis]|uniref:Uncharacterized protein n=1 Tax=Protopolystoma xenopodis TaxID=117903 RepID=A0A3S5BSG2_9PLAT|nr:unnamed protein product [Protopolystoma xenopodis]